MASIAQPNSLEKRRVFLRKRIWGDDVRPWSTGEKGFFMAPRTLPLILGLLSEKSFSGKTDVSQVYLELFASHRDGGIVDIRSEEDHAFAAGFRGTRARRSWQERMAILERNGFIRVEPKGIQKYGYVLLVHPAEVIKRLLAEGRIADGSWLRAYEACLLDAGLDEEVEALKVPE